MRKRSSSPRKSSVAAADLIVVARSARQLASAACAAGLRPVAIDLFGDDDTRACAERTVVLEAAPDLRFPPAALQAALAGIQAEFGALPLVWGSGFEGDAGLLRALEATFDVLGSPAAARVAIADPETFATTLAALGIEHPPIARERPDDSGRWLSKQQGAAGGAHVREAAPGTRPVAGRYFQRHVAGRSLSAAFVATRDGATLLGCSEHLRPQPEDAAPFRYGGALGGVVLDGTSEVQLAAAIHGMCRAFGLVGLCGIDFILDDAGRLVFLEVNPRPTATFDLLTEPGAALRAHLAACRGLPCPPLPVPPEVRGHAVLYAEHPIRIPKDIDWPPWVSDRPRAGTPIPTGAPVCSLAARGTEARTVRHLLLERFTSLHRTMHAFKA
ncbi:MAG: ATP-grasp domain-containing protein [Gammaproteobacteria bacterium]|nr:ATP-grasp domain-containing protein [Gammaproteobacteria bacterium]